MRTAFKIATRGSVRCLATLCPAAAFLTATPADAAADKVVIAPAAAWVVPIALPLPAKPDEAAITLLLQDQQLDLHPARQSRYLETAYRINKPEGLAAGNVSLSWDPDLERVTVHKLVIKRGDQVIDVLARGQTFTVVRRETNLERAVLDGQLTATLQPEGLQVGDVVDFAATIDRTDPALGEHVEGSAAPFNGAPIARLHVRAQWPHALGVRARPVGLPMMKPVRHGDLDSVDVSLDALQPTKPPRQAPLRFAYGRGVEFSDAPGWSSIAALMTPLYTRASTLTATSPLLAEIVRIKAASPDPRLRAQAALALVQDRVRYVLLAMNNGGLVPAPADTTWSRRFGDCKGKTVLLLALLHAMDIDAVPALISTSLGDGLDQRLPMVGVFDHVMVRATIGGRTYWLDGTRSGDKTIDDIATPPFKWALPLASGVNALVPLTVAPLAEPASDISLKLDATAGVAQPAKAHAERILRGDGAVYVQSQIANLAGDARDQGLREYWKGNYDFITPATYATRYDAERRELTLTMDGTARMEWNDGFYESDGTGVGYKADFTRDPGPNRDAPFAVNYPAYVRVRETVLLPPGAFTIYNPTDVDQTTAGVAYRRHAEIKGNAFSIEETERSVAPEFAAAAAPAAQEALRAMYKKPVYIQKPANYAQTEAELSVTPTDAHGLIERGNTFLNRDRMDAAITDFTKALALEPKNATALADRGLAYVWKDDKVAATRDLAAATAIDPRNAVVFRARGLMAMRADDMRSAIAALTTAIEIEPTNSWALGNRARAYLGDHQYGPAGVDAAAAIKLSPTDTNLYLLLANIAHRRGDKDLALRQATAAVAANPTERYAYAVAARIQAMFGDSASAIATLDRAIAIKPEAYLYLNRAQIRPKTDRAGRLADFDLALKLNPTSVETMIAKARAQSDAGDNAGAIATLTIAKAATPDSAGLRLQRGIAYARAGQPAAAQRDFTAARALAKSADALNALCYEKATANVVLASALEDCDAALVLAPGNAAIIDSRGFVLLRLGQYEEAVAAYDKGLAIRADSADSLYGRGIAHAVKGDRVAASADIKAALEIDPEVGETFDTYGVKLPTEAVAAPPKS